MERAAEKTDKQTGAQQKRHRRACPQASEGAVKPHTGTLGVRGFPSLSRTSSPEPAQTPTDIPGLVLQPAIPAASLETTVKTGKHSSEGTPDAWLRVLALSLHSSAPWASFFTNPRRRLREHVSDLFILTGSVVNTQHDLSPPPPRLTSFQQSGEVQG